jgi:SAM-dependent methyltransferase
MNIAKTIMSLHGKNTAAGRIVDTAAKAIFYVSAQAHRLVGKTDFSSEKLFYGIILDGDGDPKWLETILDRKGRMEVFPEILLQLVKEERLKKGGKLKVLDLGSGPLSWLAYGQDEGLIDVVAIDPLADHYRKKIKENKIEYPILPNKGTGEKLLEVVGKEEFDICFSSNAIDHADSPRRCVEGMAAACKRGGLVYLQGNIREGTRTGWVGLHRHDIALEGKELVDYEKNGKMSKVTAELGLELVLEKTYNRAEFSNHPYYVVVYRRAGKTSQD